MNINQFRFLSDSNNIKIHNKNEGLNSLIINSRNKKEMDISKKRLQ